MHVFQRGCKKKGGEITNLFLKKYILDFTFQNLFLDSEFILCEIQNVLKYCFCFFEKKILINKGTKYTFIY